VSSLEEQWRAGRVLRLNITFNQVVQEYARSLGVESTPTFLLFDAQGQEAKRWVGKAPELDELTN
jgi:hypothetical protein